MGERRRHRRVTYRGSAGDLTSQCHVCGRWVRAENMRRHQMRHRAAPASSCLITFLAVLTALTLLGNVVLGAGHLRRRGPRSPSEKPSARARAPAPRSRCRESHG